MTAHRDIFAALAAPFEQHEIKFRSQAGRTLHYITARTAMNRLDDVVGPENWWDSYTVAGEHSVLCRLTIRIPEADGGWREITKEDCGGYAGMADQGDDDKSGYSDAFKRACVKFGVSRYLYRDGVPEFARDPGHVLPDPPAGYSGGGGGQRREYDDRLPQPRDYQDRPAQSRPQAPQGGGGSYGVPRTGKALFAWTKEMEAKHEVGLLKFLNAWAKGQDFPGRMVDWQDSQVQAAYAEATRKLEGLGGQREREPGEDDE